jgi:hypothetical protein
MREMHKVFCLENMKEEDLEVDGKIILEWILGMGMGELGSSCSG